ncbi:hypothetical protein PoB_005768200 [Plakobranchus ocellatus]|uniref:Uncharacterized protein n=1 Tax=Plakobranchus ocellatus TaxID=259542 RepID=A0AAV4CI95_9GAST|nr:hypothetical protein PoB_005768200 [Plakobranchus ocellatus]
MCNLPIRWRTQRLFTSSMPYYLRSSPRPRNPPDPGHQQPYHHHLLHHHHHYNYHCCCCGAKTLGSDSRSSSKNNIHNRNSIRIPPGENSSRAPQG